MKIRTLIIDDEIHAREGIRIRLKEFPSVHIIGECSTGSEAIEMIQELKPDLLFLDIQMPEMNGFEVLQKIRFAINPLVVFITAYDRYAVKAFEVHAMDYLLKPIDDIRFKEAVNNVFEEFRRKNKEQYSDKLSALLSEYLRNFSPDPDIKNSFYEAKPNGYISRLMIKSKEEIIILNISEIDWLEAAGDYIYIHSNSKKHILRETLISLEKKLNPNKFARIHRSVIVNLDKIKNLKANEHGDFEVNLYNGDKLKLSRTYKARFQNIIERPGSDLDFL